MASGNDNNAPLLDVNSVSNDQDDKLTSYHKKRWREMLVTTKKADAPENILLQTPCLLWTGSQTTNGYGSCGYGGSKRRAHRASWMIANNVSEIPKRNEKGDMLEIRHLCNIPLCIEPTHLQLGTIAENADDKIANPNAKAKGEKHYNTSITEETARKIKLSKGSKTQPLRAKEYRVSVSIVRDIDAGTTWAHLPDKDGNNSEKKAAEMKKKKKELRDQKKKTPWTQEQWKQVEEKLTNSEYVKVHETKSFEGTPCVEWIKYTEGGYGRMSMFGLVGLKVHILACTIGNNYVRPEGKEASHKCGNSICVEPKHLYFSTPAQNTLDKFEHGTMKIKVTDEQIAEIRKLQASGVSQTKIAKQFELSQAQISRIVNNKCVR